MAKGTYVAKGGIHDEGACMAGETKIEADGMQPT